MDNKAWMFLLFVLIVFLGMAYMQQAAVTKPVAPPTPREYDGKISGQWVAEIEEEGLVTAGTLADTDSDGKYDQLTLSFAAGDIKYARNVRPAYFVIEVDDHIKDLKIEGDKVSDAIDLTVDKESIGIVYTDPEEAKDTLSITEAEVEKDGDFSFKIPVDTYDVDVDEIYVGLNFKLVSEPASNVSATKIYDITVEAREADSDYDEFGLTVYAEYTAS